MGLSSSKSKTSYNKQASPYMYGAANTLQDTVNANAGSLQSTANQMQGLASSLAGRVGVDSDLTSAAKTYATDVLGGNYLGSNPYLDGVVNQATQGAFNNVSSAFGRSGMTGSTGFGTALGRGIADAEGALRYSDYNNERSRMDQMALNAGNIDTSDLSALNAYQSLATTGASLPYVGASTLASGLTSLLGNQTTTKQSQGLGSALSQLAGIGLNAYGLGLFGGK